MGILIQEMTIEDYQDVRNLWEQTEGIETADTDSREGLSRFLERNPGLSFVARDGENIVGVVLCGHDGRIGIRKWHLFVFEDNEEAIKFWNKLGWAKRVELVTMSRDYANEGNI